MLQISNIEEEKGDWINETQLMMVENDDIQSKTMDRIGKNVITLNALEGGDQAILTSTRGQTFFIGLDRNLFENYDAKSDLLLMPTSDLKLVPTLSDGKADNTIPGLDQQKSEMVWENTTFEKSLSKDILSVIHESPRNWNELGKTEMCLEDINIVGVQEKISSDFLIEPVLVNQSKKMKIDDQQYIVGYYPVMDSNETVLVPASLMTVPQKTIDSERSQKAIVLDNEVITSEENLNQLFGSEKMDENQSVKWIKSESNQVIPTQEDFLLKVNSGRDHEVSVVDLENSSKVDKTVMELIESESVEFKCKSDISEELYAKDKKCDMKVDTENNTLREQSLPLKKKAKMKKSVNPSSSLLVSDNSSFERDRSENCCVFHDVSGAEESKIKSLNQVVAMRNHSTSEDSDEPLSRKAIKPFQKPNYKFKKKQVQETQFFNDSYNTVNCKKRKMDTLNQECSLSKLSFKTISDLLEHLKTEKLINHAIFEVLMTGLQEMEVDVLQEMYSKMEAESIDYSCHLKAFALMLHFKQPSAFNHIAAMFKNGWPSIEVVKDWKRRLNNNRKLNPHKHEM